MPIDDRLSEETSAREGTYAIERRVSPRIAILQRCLVRPEDAPNGEPWRSIAYNVSVTGIGITMPCQLPGGTFITIEAWGLPRARRLQAQIVHAKPFEFLWFCGCELAQPLSEEELQEWLKGPTDWLPQDDVVPLF